VSFGYAELIVWKKTRNLSIECQKRSLSGVFVLRYLRTKSTSIILFQAEFAGPFLVTGVAIKSRSGSASFQYVRSFRVLYSRDCSAWQYVNTTSEPWTVRHTLLSRLKDSRWIKMHIIFDVLIVDNHITAMKRFEIIVNRKLLKNVRLRLRYNAYIVYRS